MNFIILEHSRFRDSQCRLYRNYENGNLKGRPLQKLLMKEAEILREIGVWLRILTWDFNLQTAGSEIWVFNPRPQKPANNETIGEEPAMIGNIQGF